MAQRLLGPNGFVQAEEEDDGTIVIYWAGNRFYSFHPEDAFSKNLGIYLLAAQNIARRDIQRIFKVAPTTIKRILKLVRSSGIKALRDYVKGAPPVDAKIKEFVCELFQQIEGTHGYQTIILGQVKAKYDKGEFARTLSRQSLYNILNDYRGERSQRQAEAEQREKDKAQGTQREKEKPTLTVPAAPEQEGPTDEYRVVDCGGAVVAAVTMSEFGMMESIPEGSSSAEEGEGGEKFSNQELAFAYVALNGAKVVQVEQDFKQLPSYQMGGIEGREKLPSLSLYRSRIPKVVGSMNMEEVIRQTAQKMQSVFSFGKVLYVDGHFLPYYGDTEVMKNYSSQRRMALPGREYFFVHDENGLPLYATMSDGYRKMRFYLERVNHALKWIYGAKSRELLMIFDRGGSGKEFCVGITDEVRFICWRTDAARNPTVSRWENVQVVREGQQWGEKKIVKMKAWERPVVFEVEGEKRKFREIWIRQGAKMSPALTNDERMPLEEVVRKLVRRWGAQENGFKKLKEHGIDRIHSYLKEPFREEYLFGSGLEDAREGIRREVDNPLIRGLKKKLDKVKRQVNRQRDVLERAQTRGDSKALAGSKEKLRSLRRRLKAIEAAIAKEPPKVLLYKIIQEKGIERIKPEKKLFFDWLKMGAIWTRKRVVDIVGPYYEDRRDVEKFVDSILRSRTYVRRDKEVMYVEFPKNHSKVKQESLQRLCEELNKHGSLDNIGLSFKKLLFSVR